MLLTLLLFLFLLSWNCFAWLLLLAIALRRKPKILGLAIEGAYFPAAEALREDGDARQVAAMRCAACCCIVVNGGISTALTN